MKWKRIWKAAGKIADAISRYVNVALRSEGPMVRLELETLLPTVGMAILPSLALAGSTVIVVE